jgi:hypothetical protein
MTSDTKRKTLACLMGVAILTVVIAAALQHLELKPGVPFPTLADRGVQSQSEQAMAELPISISNFWKAVVSLILLVAIIYTGYQLIRNVTWSWQDAVKSLAQIVGPFLIVTCIIWILLSGAGSTSEPTAEPLPPPVAEQTGPPLGPLPLTLIWLAGLGLAAALVGAGLWIIFHPTGRTNTDRLTLQAEWALQALKMGLDLKNVIVRCYWQMGQVLQEEQGIEMQTTMTVREFERLLEARGVPPLPVHQLTQLFEMARYSHRATSAEDERQAIDALTAIMQYSRTTRL